MLLHTIHVNLGKTTRQTSLLTPDPSAFKVKDPLYFYAMDMIGYYTSSTVEPYCAQCYLPGIREWGTPH
ncbi:hypothetical protein WAI453_009642 [Rhynchosporium graminicola]